MSAGMSVCFICWCIFFDIVPRAPLSTGMTTTLIFQTFCNSILKSWYLSVFSCSLMAIFLSPGIAKSIIWHCLFCLLIQTMSGRLCSYNFICLNIEIPKYLIFVIFLNWFWEVILLTQQPVHIVLNLVVFYIDNGVFCINF